MEELYDVIDSDGNVVETAQEQLEFKDKITEEGKEIILDRAAPQLTEGELKKLRKTYVTIIHPRVIACGHRLDMTRQPRHRNCESCWFAFFGEHAELVNQCDEMFTADTGKLMSQLQGSKFTKRFTQYMSTLANWKLEKENVLL